MTSAEQIERHRRAGRTFTAAGVGSFVREGEPTAEGGGDVVLMMHGVPASSFLYRKMVGDLADRSLRGVAFDLPGLGLAERPEDFDYTWTGLGRWAVAAVDALGLEGFHLVVHDIGGPVGFELAAAMPERVRSLTVLNTVIEVDGFRRPWVMEPFARRGIGEAYLRSMSKPAFARLMYRQGIEDRATITRAEIDAYIDLLKREDGGRAFLRIMRSFERTAEKQALYTRIVRGSGYPVQVIWGEKDPALTLQKFGEQARRAADVEQIHALPAKHFLQEDQSPVIAELIARLISSNR